MRKAETEKHTLTVYLLKPEYADYAKHVKKAGEVCEITIGKNTVGTLYVKPGEDKTPPWLELFGNALKPAVIKRLNNKTASAALFIRTNKRVFVITFGFGKYLLPEEAYEERFGLKVVLNTIDRDGFRIVDRRNLDTTLTQARTQTNKLSPIGEFNLDVRQILLKAIKGKPRDASFGDYYFGADGLNIACTVSLGTIEDKCSELFRAFESNEYKNLFPWVDTLKEVKNHNRINELDEQMVNAINARNFDRVYLAIPEIFLGYETEVYTYNKDQEEGFSDIHLCDFLATTRNEQPLSAQYLKYRHVFRVPPDAEPRSAWPVYRCLNYEIKEKDRVFILTEGKWYEVGSSYVEEVNTGLNVIPFYSNGAGFPGLLPGETEGMYLKRITKHEGNQYDLVHGKGAIMFGGGHSSFELCDIFTSNRELIHFKRYGGSSVLSHLFAQGLNSARLLVLEPGFRTKADSKLSKGFKSFSSPSFRPEDYVVVFAIASAECAGLPGSLPFFSKINLLYAYKEITTMLRFSMSILRVEAARNKDAAKKRRTKVNRT